MGSTRRIMLRNLVQAMMQAESHSSSLNASARFRTSNLQLYTTELEPHLSPELMKIMEQRLYAIEYRSSSLQIFMNQPETPPSEFSRANNKELRKLRFSMELINELRTEQKVDVQLRNEDLRVNTYRSGGSGGQHANTTNSAVRVTHIPTGIVVSIQDERSQHMVNNST